MAHCALTLSSNLQGPERLFGYIEKLVRVARRPSILKNTEHLTDKTLDEWLYCYRVNRSDKLKTVVVLHKVELIRCSAMQTISAGELV